MLLASSLWLAGCSSLVPTPASTSADESAIRQRLNQWAQDFTAKNISAVCGLFAPDTILTFPSAPDRNYDAMCQGFTATFQNPDKIFRYDPPDIQEVIVSGDLAVVRLIWTLHVTDKTKPGEIVEREIGLDVFQRQPDGKWSIHISHAYPEE